MKSLTNRPSTCRYCGSAVKLQRHRTGWRYVCSSCGASVSCHRNSTTPMGTLANGPLGKLRAQTHRAFDPLWRKGSMTRDQAYQHLAQALNLPLEQVHIACFDPDDCQRAIVAAHQLRQSVCCVHKP